MMVCPPETFPNVVDCGLAAQGLVICRAMPTWTIGTLMPKEPGWLLYMVGTVLAAQGRNTDERCRSLAKYVTDTYASRPILRKPANVKPGNKPSIFVGKFKADDYALSGRKDLSRACYHVGAYWAPYKTEQQVINGHVVYTFDEVIVGALVAAPEDEGALYAYDYAISRVYF